MSKRCIKNDDVFKLNVKEVYVGGSGNWDLSVVWKIRQIKQKEAHMEPIASNSQTDVSIKMTRFECPQQVNGMLH